jgi:hypothetical protein
MSESISEMRSWKSYLPRLLLRVPIAMAAAWLFLIALHLSAEIGPNRVEQIVANPAGALQNCLPSLRDLESNSVDGMGKKCSIKAGEVTIRNRQYGDAVFTSFKDVIISHVSVFTEVETTADFLDWVNGRDLYLLMGLVLANSQAKNDDITAFGSRLVIEDLAVYVGQDGKRPRLWLSAERLTREFVSDEIVFMGQLTLETDPAQRITCLRTAKWLPSQKTMYFPEGFLVNGKALQSRYWVAAGKNGTAGKVLMGGMPSPQIQHTSLSLPSGKRIGPKEIRKLLVKKDRKAMQELLLQYFVLNPDALKAEGIFPMLMLGPDFKLGQFTPGLLAAGMNDGLIEAPPGRSPRPQVSKDMNPHGTSGIAY